MNLLPHWVLTDKFPAFYDLESKTAIEQTARVYAAMQTLIAEYNSFVDSVNQHITDFENAAKKDYEIFTTAIRQEFQDFIDVVTLKIQSQDSIIDDAVSYMKTNLSESIDAALLEMRASGGFSQEVLKVYADIENQIAALNSRMNTFTTLEEGSTTGDAEMQDGRTDYTGKTWDNIGSHIRGVTSQLSSEISDSIEWNIDTLWTDNNYIFADNGYTASINGCSRTDFIHIPYYVKEIVLKGIKNPTTEDNRGMSFYSSANETNFISGYRYENDNSSDVIISVPEGANYFRYSCLTDWKSTHKIFYSIVKTIDFIGNQMIDNLQAVTGDGKTINAISEPYNNFDTLPINRVITYATDWSNVVNLPPFPIPYNYGGVVITASHSHKATTGIIQLCVSGNGQMAFRINYGGYWCSWRIVARMSDVYDAISNTTGRLYTSLSVFESFGVIGDSFASGEIYVNGQVNDYYNLSWGQILARQYGVECKNFSTGGLTTRTWLTSEVGLPNLLGSNARKIYYLALGINDYYSLGIDYLGSIADIHDDFTQNADTFYGNYGKIIGNIKAHAPNAKIVMFTLATTDGVAPQFSEAIINIANHFGIPYIVQRDDEYFLSDFYTSFVQGHPVAITYSGMAQAFARLLDKCMIENYDYFKDYVG